MDLSKEAVLKQYKLVREQIILSQLRDISKHVILHTTKTKTKERKVRTARKNKAALQESIAILTQMKKTGAPRKPVAKCNLSAAGNPSQMGSSSCQPSTATDSSRVGSDECAANIPADANNVDKDVRHEGSTSAKPTNHREGTQQPVFEAFIVKEEATVVPPTTECRLRKRDLPTAATRATEDVAQGSSSAGTSTDVVAKKRKRRKAVTYEAAIRKRRKS